MDRRRTGVNRVVIEADNGEKQEIYTATASKAQTWTTLFIGLATPATIVFGAARCGVQIEVHDAIKAEAQEETGIIHREIEDCVEELLDDVQEEQKATKEAVVRLEERQGAVIKTVDTQHREVMTELRAIRSGDSD